jgi:hypothetical protein
MNRLQRLGHLLKNQRKFLSIKAKEGHGRAYKTY